MKNRHRNMPGLWKDPKSTDVCGAKALESMNTGTKRGIPASQYPKALANDMVGSRGLSMLHRPKQAFIQTHWGKYEKAS